jgi:hypothetical protein
MVGSYKNKHIVEAMCFQKEIKKDFILGNLQKSRSIKTNRPLCGRCQIF